MADDPFESPKFLIAQTRNNLTEFEAISNALFDGESHAHIVDVDPKTRNKTFKIRFLRRLPPKARHIVATAISDLRHALDQAIFTSIKIITNADPGLIYYPFATNPKDLQGRLTQYVPPELHPLLLSFESYPTGKGYVGGNDFLANLGKATGANKHQVSCQVKGIIPKFRADDVSGSGIIHVRIPPIWDETNYEFTIGNTSPHGYIKYDFYITFHIVLDNAGALSGHSALDCIRYLTGIVDGIVNGLEAETARIIAAQGP